MTLLTNFLTTGFQNNRSSKRTDALHVAIVDELLRTNPDLNKLDVEYEYQIKDGYGGTFDIDIVFLNPQGEIEVAILVKSINSNVNKNIKNYANTSVGEAARCMYAENPPKQVYFISLMPRQAPKFDKSGVVTGLDNVISAVCRTRIQSVLDQQYSGKVVSTNLYYDITDVAAKIHKEQFKTIDIENITEFKLRWNV